MSSQCAICLSAFHEPVCIPCGHIFCKDCLIEYANGPANQGLTANCPTCRTSFHLVMPDLSCLAPKYHPFVTSNIRRVYHDFSSYAKLQQKLKKAESSLETKKRGEEALMSRCESLGAALQAHREGEADANERIIELEDEMRELESYFKGLMADMKAEQREKENAYLEEIERLKDENRAMQQERREAEAAHEKKYLTMEKRLRTEICKEVEEQTLQRISESLKTMNSETRNVIRDRSFERTLSPPPRELANLDARLRLMQKTNQPSMSPPQGAKPGLKDKMKQRQIRALDTPPSSPETRKENLSLDLNLARLIAPLPRRKISRRIPGDESPQPATASKRLRLDS
ncbi:hypothetical protein CVT24_008438 [Panaeolus cyanescens]|uniref:RING-type domain-containing protein n=1 Tax=Panaeolus cyanescens TaxID=181874 RepID=A0A409VD07_9AGAR|nr:hypothetical protein CVT24_008438 [Panaeolus cyanescens]